MSTSLALIAALAATVSSATSTATISTATISPAGVEPLPEVVEAPSGANPLIITGTSLVMVGVVAAWGGGAWWTDGFQSFSFRETGFLGKNTYAGGADKIGHLYTTYLCTMATTKLYETLGMDHDAAALVAAGAVTLVANGIELADGFTHFGFEYGDVIFNTIGISFALVADLSPEFHSMFGLRMAYWPSHDFLENDKTFIKWINDYTGMQFYFDVKMKGVLEQLEVDPGLARYLLVSAVYGTSKYSPIEVREERRRSLGLSLGISLPQVLRDAYRGDPGVEMFATFFDYYAFPFISVAALTDLNTGEWFINFGVSNRLELGL